MPAPSFLALGDSYTIGEGVADDGRWPVQLATRLRAADVPVGDPRIIATTGWTTDELSAAMDGASFAPAYGLVTLLIGVNNQYRGRPLDDYREPCWSVPSHWPAMPKESWSSPFPIGASPASPKAATARRSPARSMRSTPQPPKKCNGRARTGSTSPPPPVMPAMRMTCSLKTACIPPPRITPVGRMRYLLKPSTRYRASRVASRPTQS